MATYNGNQQDSSGNVLLPISNSMATYIETGSTASRAYTKGTYFFYRNRLVKAKSAISSGATLTIGSNVEYVNIADEVSAHLRANDTDKSEFYFDYYNNKYGFYPNANKVASEFVPFGGGYAETVLWTNPSPTSDFASQAITSVTKTLVSNYDFIKFTFKYNKSSSYMHTVIYPVYDVIHSDITGGALNPCLFQLAATVVESSGSTNNTYGRAMFLLTSSISSSNGLQITDAFKNSGSTKSNGYCVPYQVIGLK